MCGEQYDADMSGALETGSPPRVRGTDEILLYPAAFGGITPACAGNRRSC